MRTIYEFYFQIFKKCVDNNYILLIAGVSLVHFFQVSSFPRQCSWVSEVDE